MKQKYIGFSIIVLLAIATISGYILIKKDSLSKDKNNETGYIGCVSLKEGETYDIELLHGLHKPWTAGEEALKLKEDGRCIDAWVNERGNCVERHNKATIEVEYKRSIEILISEVERINKTDIHVDVSYDFCVATYYVNETTTLTDWSGAIMVIGPTCLLLQLYSGIPYDNVKLTIEIIYEPSGKEMFNIHAPDDIKISEEEWNQKLLEMKE